jgi:hypothetical protein
MTPVFSTYEIALAQIIVGIMKQYPGEIHGQEFMALNI